MLLHHGSADDVLPFTHSMTTFETIKQYVYSKAKPQHQNNFKVVCEEGLGHTIKEKGKEVVKQWLVEVLENEEKERSESESE